MSVLAYDLGAGSGRALIGKLVDERITIEEIHRFSNDPVQIGDRLHWDILRLFYEIKQGLLKAKHQHPGAIRSLAIDSWAVDFGLIGKHGELLGNPYHYRDRHTEGMMDELFEIVPRSEIFKSTGIQFLPFNTIYQLYALRKARSPLLNEAQSLLMIPDLLRYFLTGKQYGEFTNSTCSQLYDPIHKRWDKKLLDTLGLSDALFPKMLQPGSYAGELRASICSELGIDPISVYTAAEHDTASAVVAIPAVQKDFAYLICGTWSLMGTEVDQPVINDQAARLNFTNEGGVADTYRLLKNIMGLWILEECKRTWEREGLSLTYEQMISDMKPVKPFRSLIDPDAAEFLNPEHMPKQIQQFCRDTQQPVPETIGEFVRCILESLALKYRYVLKNTEQLSNKSFAGLHMVGGGIKNEALCQFTANAIGRPVWAGPAEGSAIGNIMVQYMALGEVQDIWQARQIVKNSFAVKTFEPDQHEQWNQAYKRFKDVNINLQNE